MPARKRRVSAHSSGSRKRKSAARASSRKVLEELARLRRQLADCKRELSEARQQQAATSEVLRVISSSPTDVQPVFDTIAERATRLCDAKLSFVFLFDGEWIRLAAVFGIIPEGVEATRKVFPMRPGSHSVAARTILDGAVVHVSDVLADPEYLFKNTSKVAGYRGALGVPLLREGRIVGGITVARAEVGYFSDRQIKLLENFAAQAVIAIENVRLFNETKEALEQQTATAEILRVIGGSLTDTQPVFDAIVKNCSALFKDARILLRILENGLLHPRASVGESDVPAIPVDCNSGTGACMIQGRVIHFPDLVVAAEEYPSVQHLGLKFGYRSGVYAPLMRGGQAIGAISILRRQQGAFTDKELALLRTFADQAVIAIENVRLFKELQARNTEITEALEQQTATAEILCVISSTPTDIQPVLDAVAENAARLCGASDVIIRRVDGNVLRIATHFGSVPVVEETVAISRGTVGGRAALERRTIHIHDFVVDHARGEYPENPAGLPIRTMLCAPLLREDSAIGTITMRRPEVRPFSDKQIKLLETFAAQAVIAIENVRLFRETNEALERQTVTADILKVISGSPTDTQPVFDAIVKSGVHLFGGMNVSLRLVKGDHTELAASTDPATVNNIPLSDDGSLTTRAIQRREVVHVPDIFAEEWVAERSKQRAKLRGFRAMISAPMLREDYAIGVISVTRATPGPFTDKEVALLRTFADQAVIAIENVRLFNETKEALEQQTATAEVLKVISGSPTDVQPVFDAIVQSCAHLFGSMNATLRLVKGDRSELVASTAPNRESLGLVLVPLDNDRLPAARAVLRREVVQVSDAFTEEWVSSEFRQRAAERGFRSIMVAPMLREGNVIGTINVSRPSPGPFTDKQVALLKTFADQAVIAIENVRLFNETKEALEQQTVISEILRVISGSPTDTQPVFDAILEKATRLCDAHMGTLRLYDGNVLRRAATFGISPEYARWVAEEGHKHAPQPDGAMGRMIAEKQPVQILDRRNSPGYLRRSPNVVAMVELGGVRTFLAVPMLKEGRVVGGIAVYRPVVQPFTQKQIDLLSTFASQAVIAIENVRLFNEINEALQRQTATAEILRVISDNPTDVMPVLDAVTHRAAQLCDAPDARLFLVDGDALRYVAGFGEFRGVQETLPLTRGIVTGRAILDRAVVHIEDLAAVFDEFPEARNPQQQFGHRTTLAVPLVREGKAFGAILMRRREVRPFTEKQIELVKTFADQAVIAIENVRLFKEIQDKSRQLEIANKHKSDFLANMSHELRTPLNAIIGFSEALLEKMFGEMTAKQEDYLKDIHSSGRHLLSLINDILDLSKVEAGRMELELSEFSLPAALANAMTLVRERAQTHGIALTLKVDPKLGDMRADERKFKQIVLNLLSNAVKFTPDGGRVEVAARMNGSAVEVSVMDTGVGIAQADQEAVFEEFKQVGRDSTTKQEGTGLGLALTRRFVELHGGKLSLESAPGKGSMFTFTLPLNTVIGDR